MIPIAFWAATALIFVNSIRNYNRLSWWHAWAAGWIVLAWAAN